MVHDGTGWAEVERLTARLEERLESFWNQGDREAVTDPSALAEATALRELALHVPEAAAGTPVTPYVLDLPAVHRVACLHYARCLVQGPATEEARPEAQLTLALFVLVHQFAPEEVPEDLRETVAAADLPPARDLHTSWTRALELFGRWQAAGDPEALEGAISLWSGALEVVPASHPGYAMLLSNLGTALRFRYTLRGNEDDLERALATGRRAVEHASADDPDRAMYLANLSGSLALKYAARGAGPTSTKPSPPAPNPYGSRRSPGRSSTPTRAWRSCSATNRTPGQRIWRPRPKPYGSPCAMPPPTTRSGPCTCPTWGSRWPRDSSASANRRTSTPRWTRPRPPWPPHRPATPPTAATWPTSAASCGPRPDTPGNRPTWTPPWPRRGGPWRPSPRPAGSATCSAGPSAWPWTSASGTWADEPTARSPSTSSSGPRRTPATKPPRRPSPSTTWAGPC
ncbi:hypothetical protein ACFQ2B_32935 [Streptomyces stramineus]